MLDVYLSSPKSKAQAAGLRGQDVLLSYAEYGPHIDEHVGSFRRVLIDSGAYAAFSRGKKVELSAYLDWALSWQSRAVAIAGLDDIAGDWRLSLRNYGAFPQGFPTYHWSDPVELLPDLLALCQERGQWLGLGLCGPQKQVEEAKLRWLVDTLEQVPKGVHVHGWALGAYADQQRLDSIDSTRWMGIAADLAIAPYTCHLDLTERVWIAARHLERRMHARRTGEAKGPGKRRTVKAEPGPGLFEEEGGVCTAESAENAERKRGGEQA